jgi:hypothetical protein
VILAVNKAIENTHAVLSFGLLQTRGMGNGLELSAAVTYGCWANACPPAIHDFIEAQKHNN